MKGYIREQQHLCGPTAEAARYKEVDLFPVTARQHRASPRAKKALASSLVQKNLNEANSKRWFCQLGHTNFGDDDYSLHLTFTDEFHPATDAEAWKIFERFIDRLNYHRRKRGLGKVKWMAVLELQGKKKPRYHFHLLMDGLFPPKEILARWRVGRGANSRQIGACNIRNLDFEGHGGSIADLCYYMMKHPESKRRWRSSKNLDKPKLPAPNDSRYSRTGLEDMRKNRLDDYDWWRKQYPGWELIEPAKAKYNDFTGWSLYARLRRTHRPRPKPKRRVHNNA